MFNSKVVLSGFWQLAKHWRKDDADKVELACKDMNLQMQLLASLGHPDKPHFPDPFFLTLSEEEVSFSNTPTKASLEGCHGKVWSLESSDKDVHPSKESNRGIFCTSL